MGFSRQENWSGLPFPPPGDLPDTEIEFTSPAYPVLAGGFFTTSATWEAQLALIGLKSIQFSSFQVLTRVLLFVTPWTAARQASLSITNSQSLLKLMSIKSVMPSNHPTISSSVVPFSSHFQSFPASGSFPVSQFFPSGGQSIGVSASASSPSNEYSGLISFRMDWLDLLAVQGTLKSLLQHHSSKHQFFSAQLSLWSNSHIHT